MNRNIIFTFLLLCSTVLLFSGCKKYTQEFLGPEYVEASDNFAVENNSFQIWRKNKNSGLEFLIVNNLASFSANSQFYKATFNERVSWTIKVTAWKSGAQRIINGLSDVLNVENSIWDGGANNGLFFSNGDSIEIAIHFAGSQLVLRDTLLLNGVKGYNSIDPATGVKYFTVDDFEGGYTATVGLSPFYADLQDIGGGNTGNNAFAGDKVQGKFSYRMYGKDVNNNTYIGSCNTPTLNDFPDNAITTTNADSLFINMYIKGTGKQNTTVTILALENDANHPSLTYDITKNDRWIYFIPVEWEGWKLVSVPYSAFKRPGSNAGLGDNLLTPNKLCGLALELDSYPAGGYEVEAYIDMLVITQNGRFKQ